MPAQHDATASYLGYLFQGQYALLALWDTDDDDAAVSVETADDVVLEGRELRLAQLKHSEGRPAALTVTNVGFWRTIRIWAAHLSQQRSLRQGAGAADAASEAATDTAEERTKYLFVTVADLAADSALTPLVAGIPRTESVVEAAVGALAVEATRVRDERTAAAAAGNALPHADRAAGCEAFLALTDAQRQRLVARLEILPGGFRIADVQVEVERRLQQAGSVRATIRRSVAERIIERWDRQIALGLMGQRSREVRRTELLGMVEDLIREHGPTMLTNDYGPLDPAAGEYEAAQGSVLERQIDLVDGGAPRVRRAVRDRWRARNQRRRWTDDDASLVGELKTYDDVLKEAWSDQHAPMCHDCRGLDDAEHRRRGLAILDWAHDSAPISVRPPRPGWSDAFYARGMLQQFADDLEVGWHPEYLSRLGAAATGAAPTSPTAGSPPAPPSAEPAPATSPTAQASPLTTLHEAFRDQVPSDRAPVAASESVSPETGGARHGTRPRRTRVSNSEPASTE